MDGKNSKSALRKFGTSTSQEGIGEMEVVTHSILRRFGYLERMGANDMARKIQL